MFLQKKGSCNHLATHLRVRVDAVCYHEDIAPRKLSSIMPNAIMHQHPFANNGRQQFPHKPSQNKQVFYVMSPSLLSGESVTDKEEGKKKESLAA